MAGLSFPAFTKKPQKQRSPTKLLALLEHKFLESLWISAVSIRFSSITRSAISV
jgi:hypothetical protein